MTPPSQTALRSGERAAWGPKPDAETPRRQMVLRSWKPIRKEGSSLLGLACVTLPIGLQIDDIPVLRTGDKIWASLPAKPVITKEGNVARLPGIEQTAEPKYPTLAGPRNLTAVFAGGRRACAPGASG
jgi:hypothetical protein